MLSSDCRSAGKSSGRLDFTVTTCADRKRASYRGGSKEYTATIHAHSYATCRPHKNCRETNAGASTRLYHLVRPYHARRLPASHPNPTKPATIRRLAEPDSLDDHRIQNSRNIYRRAVNYLAELSHEPRMRIRIELEPANDSMSIYSSTPGTVLLLGHTRPISPSLKWGDTTAMFPATRFV